MGFTYRRVLALEFEDPTFAGLEAKAYVPSLQAFLDVLGAVDAQEDASTGAEVKAALLQVLELFAPFLKEWNLTDENDEPVPTTVAGLLSQDMHLVTAIISAWREGVSAVARPLDETSTSGAPPLEVSIPMDVSSPSLAS